MISVQLQPSQSALGGCYGAGEGLQRLYSLCQVALQCGHVSHVAPDVARDPLSNLHTQQHTHTPTKQQAPSRHDTSA